MVHASGVPTIIEDRGTIERMLVRLVDEHESRSEKPWRMDLPVDYLQKMIDGIVAFEVQTKRIQGKFKLSQNHRPEDQRGAIAGLRDNGEAAFADLMQEHFSDGE